VSNTRECLSHIINNFYSNPSGSFKLIGVTGTNGKTSVTTIARYVFMKLGFHTGLIGTIDNFINQTKLDIEKTTPTTPDCVELGKIMDMFVQKNADVALMDVSSMALKTHRVDHCQFDIAAFTNISPEHLDNHKTMEDYVSSKLHLFDLTGKAVVNVDDEYSGKVLDRCQGEILRYGLKNPDLCDIYAKDISYSSENVSFTVVYKHDTWHGHSLAVNREMPLTINIPSEFAIYNNLAAIGICLKCGIDFENIIDVLHDDIYIEGRYDVVKAGQPYTVIIDYAHTPAALENILNAVRKNDSYKRIITVFGCGGDRDKSKRSTMGKISQHLSDITILTSDNPRTEKPYSIIADIRRGMDNGINRYLTIEDRKEAIEYALSIAEADDAILIAGKGHEKTQIFDDYSIDFSDKEVVLQAINNSSFLKS
jgi:UDP-N-acetylmuramoyl-L-alanyl-D-glutamate--2,6-diaminopimelate ligase